MTERNTHGEIIHHDEYGVEYVVDEAGNRRPPMQSTNRLKSVSGFSYYDSSQGHCALCGKLTCHGGCFK